MGHGLIHIIYTYVISFFYRLLLLISHLGHIKITLHNYNISVAANVTRHMTIEWIVLS